MTNMEKVNINKNQESNVIAYATHSIMYMNDFMCNTILSLAPYVKNEDKETQKIYRALEKRAKAHLKEQVSIFSVHMEYFAEYCSCMDEKCDDAYNALLSAVKAKYEAVGIEKSEYMAMVEVMRVIASFVKESTNNIIASCIKVTRKACALDVFMLRDIAKIAENFTRWVFRKVRDEDYSSVNDDENVVLSFKDFCEAMLDYNLFVNSSNIAVKEVNLIKKDGKEVKE